MRGNMAPRQNFDFATIFLFATPETETCLESCIIHIPTTHPCSTRVGVLEMAKCVSHSPFLR